MNKIFLLIIISSFFLTSCTISLENREAITPENISTSQIISAIITENSEDPDDTDLPDTAETEKNIPTYSYSVKNINDFNSVFEKICNENMVIGASLAVFASGEIIHTVNFGFENLENMDIVTDETVFRTASVSKIVSAMAALKLYEDGLLDLNQPISEILYLPIGENSNPKITTLHLLTHTAGLTDYYNPKVLTLDKMLEEGQLATAENAGVNYSYSNMGYGLVGTVIESITNEKFSEYADRMIFDKIGADMGYLKDSLRSAKSFANIYKNSELRFDVINSEWSIVGFYNQLPIGKQYNLAQSELFTTATNLAKIGIILSGDGSFNEVNILSHETLDFMHTPFLESSPYDICIGTRRYDGNVIDGKTIFGHPGQAYGMVAGLYYDRDDSIGFALITNGCNITTAENSLYKINNDTAVLVYDSLEKILK